LVDPEARERLGRPRGQGVGGGRRPWLDEGRGGGGRRGRRGSDPDDGPEEARKRQGSNKATGSEMPHPRELNEIHVAGSRPGRALATGPPRRCSGAAALARRRRREWRIRQHFTPRLNDTGAAGPPTRPNRGSNNQ